MAPIDPHSFTDSIHPLATKITLKLLIDFENSIIHGTSLISFPSAYTGPLSLDMHSLMIHDVLDPETGQYLSYSYTACPDPIIGSPLECRLFGQSSILVLYSTLPSSPGLIWLPPFTDVAVPFLYARCQSTYARSVFPCQDIPAARVCFEVVLNVPSSMRVVMTANQEDWYFTDSSNYELGKIFDSTDFGTFSTRIEKLWSQRRSVFKFQLDHPIPPYLFAFAVGDMEFYRIGRRTRIFSDAELMPLLKKAQKQFMEVDDVISQGERLFGTYEWLKYDLYILHPNYPYDGFGTPMTVFLSPSVINGDVTMPYVAMRELARAWTGNLITHSRNEHLWLSEGFTTYAERRLVEVLQGKEKADLYIRIGWSHLKEEMQRFSDKMEFTKLKTNMIGINPNDVFSQVPAEKGYQFLYHIESQVGRPEFDKFLKKYIATFKFESIDTEIFLGFLKSCFSDIEKHMDLVSWTEDVGIPEDVSEPISILYEKIVSMANDLSKGNIPKKEQVVDWQGQEWELYLEKVPKNIGASKILTLDGRYNLSKSQDLRVKVAFLQLAISSRCTTFYIDVKETLMVVGNIKYLRPLYDLLLQEKSSDEVTLARMAFNEARGYYHPIVRGIVESIFVENQVDLI